MLSCTQAMYSKEKPEIITIIEITSKIWGLHAQIEIVVLESTCTPVD